MLSSYHIYHLRSEMIHRTLHLLRSKTMTLSVQLSSSASLKDWPDHRSLDSYFSNSDFFLCCTHLASTFRIVLFPFVLPWRLTMPRPDAAMKQASPSISVFKLILLYHIHTKPTPTSCCQYTLTLTMSGDTGSPDARDTLSSDAISATDSEYVSVLSTLMFVLLV
jgi:hypothetical protein